jgi:hypothetical protein
MKKSGEGRCKKSLKNKSDNKIRKGIRVSFIMMTGRRINPCL